MTPQPMHLEGCVSAMTSSAFLPLGGFNSGVYGLKITPVFIAMNQHVAEPRLAQRGISAAERSLRVSRNPLRAAAMVQGRQRLAQVAQQRNPRFKPLSVLRLAAGLSQAELAVRMNMQQPNIARLEKAPGDLSLSTLQKLSAALGADMAQVIAAVEASNQLEADRV